MSSLQQRRGCLFLVAVALAAMVLVAVNRFDSPVAMIAGWVVWGLVVLPLARVLWDTRG